MLEGEEPFCVTAGGEMVVFNLAFETVASCDPFHIGGGKVTSSIDCVAPSQLSVQLSDPPEGEHPLLVLSRASFGP